MHSLLMLLILLLVLHPDLGHLSYPFLTFLVLPGLGTKLIDKLVKNLPYSLPHLSGVLSSLIQFLSDFGPKVLDEGDVTLKFL